MRRALAGLGAALALAALAGCAALPAAAPNQVAAPVDTECVGGMRFVDAYSAVAARYDPQYESYRQQLAGAGSPDAARSLLHQLSILLDGYDGELSRLAAPADFSDALTRVVGAGREMSAAALQLAASSFAASDQAAFQARVDARHAAVHDLQLQVAFVTAECR